MAASSSSSSSIPKFDVFLSYNSADYTIRYFVSNLYRSSSEKGITTYYKDDENPEEIVSSSGSVSSDLRNYIVGSKLAVVVVSRSYPTSVSCLNELQTILSLRDQGQLSVLLIYYRVDPSNVRRQTGVYVEAFKKHDKEHSDEEVEAWKRALTKLTSMPGLDSRFWRKESEMIDLITSEISLLVSKSNEMDSPPSDGTVALDRHMEALYEFLDLKSDKEVRLVGICGPGGVGKTTLARHAYEEISVNFQAHMFLDNSETENYHQHHQQNEAQTKNKSLNVGSDVIKSALGHRKSLLVTDFEDKLELFTKEEIVGWFGSGSRVILVTQEKDLLVKFGVEHFYEVETLRYDEALELFSLSAFKQLHPPTNFESLSLRAVQVASFLPLSLKILGSSLQGKDEKAWEEELAKLEGDQEKTIMEVMKGNYKGAKEQKGEIEDWVD